MSARDPLAAALDRFDVPPMSEGLADRIVSAATRPGVSAPRPRRDRRGLWRRGRQVLLGSVAVGLLSAGAVASGLLGRVGINVPVLTAMLDPAPKPRPAAKPKPRVEARATPTPKGEAPPSAVVPTPPTLVERQVARIERRARFRAFAEEHPHAARAIVRRVGHQIRQRDAVRREILGLPPADPQAPDWRPLTLEERFMLGEARRRDLRRVEIMLERRLAARNARLAAQSRSVTNTTADPPVALPDEGNAAVAR